MKLDTFAQHVWFDRREILVGDSIVEATVAGLMTGPVDFSPFLDNGIDTDLGTDGFQGDFSTLHVTALGDQLTGLIQEAVDLATNSTVIVHPGSFDSVSINRPGLLNLTLRSATGNPADVVINGLGASSAVEVVAPANVTLQDFTATAN